MINNFKFFRQKKYVIETWVRCDKKYMYNIGVGLDASLLFCLNNGFADLVYFGNNLNYR